MSTKNWILLAVLVLLVVLVVARLSGCGDNREQIVLPPLSEFVKAVHVEGMPAETATLYPDDQTDILLGWLADPAWEDHWANIVHLIGFIARGEDDDVMALEQLLARPSVGPVSYAEYAARQAVLLSLGHIVFYSNNARALAYLERSIEPTGWNDGRLGWKTPFNEGPEFMRKHFSKLGVLGLTLTGVPSAKARIADLIADPSSPDAENNAYRAAEQAFFQDALMRVQARIDARAAAKAGKPKVIKHK